MHPVDSLFATLPSVEPYPAGVIRVPDRIPGVAFFPGGAGLWGVEEDQALPPMPVGGVMVLGHDFHSETGFSESLAQRTEVPAIPSNGYRVPATWVALQQLLDEAAIPLSECFFTNAYMGLREGSESMGRFPGSRDLAFKNRCRSFLLRQLHAQRPAIVLTLGIWLPAFVAPLAPQLRAWRAATTLASLDRAGPLVEGVVFDDAIPPCTVVGLTHPCLRNANVRHRRYAGFSGHNAELVLLREAIGRSGISFRNS